MAKTEMVRRGKEFRDEFLELKLQVFPGDAVDRKRESWDWLFKNPYSEDSRETYIRSVERDGKPVGAQILMPTLMVVLGKRFDGLMPMSTLVLPQNRGAGLSLLKIAFNDEAPPVSCGLASTDKLTQVYEKLGGTLSPPRTLRRKVYKLGTVLKEKKSAVPAAIASGLNIAGAAPLTAANLRTPRLAANETIEEFETFSEDFDAAWDECEPRVDFAQVRRSGFLNWRYVAIPIATYRRMALRRDGVLVGYVVTQIHDAPGATVGRVSDIFSYQNTVRDCALLISAADAHFRDAGCTRSEMSFGRSPVLDAAAARCGFLSRKEIRPIAAHLRNPDEEGRLKKGIANFHFCRGDHDEDY